MVKKVVAVLVVFSIIITSLCFSVSADDFDDVQATLKMYYNYTLNGVSKTANNLVPNQPSALVMKNSTNPSDTIDFEIDRLYFLDHNTINTRYFISLKCGFFETFNNPSDEWHAFSTPGFQNITNSTDFVFRNYPSHYYDPQFTLTSSVGVDYQIYWHGSGFWFYGVGNRKPSFDLDRPVHFTYNPGSYNGQHILWIVFYDVKVIPDYNWLWYQINNYLNTFTGYLLDIVQNTEDLLVRLTGESSWSVTRDQFDSDGNFLGGQEVHVTWYDAIYQLLSNLYAPVKVQSEQEQKAKEAGAMNALDDAYEAADDAGSFWDLIPFIGFAGFGDYDDDAASDLGTGSITDWFSDTNKGWLENVPVQRYADDDFVDFYQQNLDDINDLLGDQTSRSIRGSP